MWVQVVYNVTLENVWFMLITKKKNLFKSIFQRYLIILRTKKTEEDLYLVR